MANLVRRNTDSIYILFFSLCLMLYQSLLTRVFSVLWGNHLAFFAVSLTMLGLTLGALFVSLLGKKRCSDRYCYYLEAGSTLLSISILAVVAQILSGVGLTLSISAIISYCLLYSLPMIFCSFLVSIILLKHSDDFAKFYSWDLFGASLGCIAFVVLLKFFDPFSILFGIATFCLIISCLIGGRIKKTKAVLVLICILLFSIQSFSSYKRQAWLTIAQTKGSFETGTIFERWNAFSRVRIWQELGAAPFGWGMSTMAPKNKKADELGLNIDGSAYTVITKFDGDFSKVDHLKFDITNLIHHIKHNASVFVVGVGGGRDVLSSLVFDQKSIDGAELNPAIFEALGGEFADFSGNLLKNPKVHLVNHEARTYLAGINRKFDIIKISLVDTWAATAGGAFALSENALYTQEGFQMFLEHLNADGILSLSRWYPNENYNEIKKLLVLSTKSLMSLGVKNPREHMYLARSPTKGVGTLLVKKSPFLKNEIIALDKFVDNLAFEKKLSPLYGEQSFLKIINPTSISNEVLSNPNNIEAPTDDSPFFFMFERSFSPSKIFDEQNILGKILFVTILISAFIAVSLFYIKNRSGFKFNKKILRNTGYVSLIGLGFMFIEISLLQRLSLFLGHPSYALTVTLFTLLLSVGVGSAFSAKLSFVRRKKMLLTFLPIVLLAHYMCFNGLSNELLSAVLLIKVLFSVLLIFPVGFMLGMPMPFAISDSASQGSEDFLWTINGLASVNGAILAVIVCIFCGISFAYKIGIGIYSIIFILV